MSKIIGLITAHYCQDWIGPCIKQAKDMCDEVLVSVGPHSNSLEKYKDNTYNIASTFSDITLLKAINKNNHKDSKRCTLNNMIEHSNLFEKGNWIWILDCDEFFKKIDQKAIKLYLSLTDVNHIGISERFFFYNMTYYATGYHWRLHRITDANRRFTGLQSFATGPTEIIPGNLMFHYSMLSGLDMRIDQWSTEYPGNTQRNKVSWFKKYMKSSIGEMPFPHVFDFTFDDKKLFNYTGTHPEYIEEAGLHLVKDFRHE